MKFFCISLLAMLLLAANCKKPKHENPIDQLPPETQIGANTFGCLVDGKAFIPNGDPFGGPIKKAAYQYVNGRNRLVVSGRKDEKDGMV